LGFILLSVWEPLRRSRGLVIVEGDSRMDGLSRTVAAALRGAARRAGDGEWERGRVAVKAAAVETIKAVARALIALSIFYAGAPLESSNNLNVDQVFLGRNMEGEPTAFEMEIT